MGRIIAMVGPSGSGKSTRAKELRKELVNDGEDVVIVNRDKLREMCFSYTEDTISEYYTDEKLGIHEYMISEISDTIIKQALREKKVVVVDNTHLKQKYLKDLWKYGVLVTYDILITPLEDCIKRDSERTRKVGKEVIEKQYKVFEQLLKDFDFTKDRSKPIDKVVVNENLPKAIIFDIDGTLAHMDGRSPYDMSKVQEDTLDEPVFRAYEAAKKAGYKIIICTGREGSSEGITNTQCWLHDNNVIYDEFYIRPEKCYDPDWKIKEDMWRHISMDYHIVAMYDDRNQVVDHARKLGFKVFQVAEGNF